MKTKVKAPEAPIVTETIEQDEVLVEKHRVRNFMASARIVVHSKTTGFFRKMVSKIRAIGTGFKNFIAKTKRWLTNPFRVARAYESAKAWFAMMWEFTKVALALAVAYVVFIWAFIAGLSLFGFTEE